MLKMFLQSFFSGTELLDLLLNTYLAFFFRCPAALKAATEEVKSIFERSNQKVDPKDPKLVLTREQLDNMPVLGTVLEFKGK